MVCHLPTSRCKGPATQRVTQVWKRGPQAQGKENRDLLMGFVSFFFLFLPNAPHPFSFFSVPHALHTSTNGLRTKILEILNSWYFLSI